jgi:hypothetical protein
MPPVSTMEYLNILGHFLQGTYEVLDGKISVTNFNYINSSYCDANCLVTNVKKTLKQRRTLTRTLCRGTGRFKRQ